MMTTSPIRSGAAIGLLAALPALGAGQAPPPSKVDWAGIADLVVSRSFKLSPGERAVLFWDRSADRGAFGAMRKAVLARGGVVAGEIDMADPPDAAAWARQFADADVAI